MRLRRDLTSASHDTLRSRWLFGTRARILKRGLEGGHLPGRVGPEGLWQCNGYCPFTKFCWPKGVPRSDDLRQRLHAKITIVQNVRVKATGQPGAA